MCGVCVRRGCVWSVCVVHVSEEGMCVGCV